MGRCAVVRGDPFLLRGEVRVVNSGFVHGLQENSAEKAEYLRQLKHFLKEQPPLGDASEEVNIRDALLSLEKHVTQYCRKHQITSPPIASSKVCM